jgi:hypothetical protein
VFNKAPEFSYILQVNFTLAFRKTSIPALDLYLPLFEDPIIPGLTPTKLHLYVSSDDEGSFSRSVAQLMAQSRLHAVTCMVPNRGYGMSPTIDVQSPLLLVGRLGHTNKLALRPDKQ